MSRGERERALAEIGEAGRSLSDSAVLYHGALAGRLGLNSSDWKVLGLLERDGALSAGDLSSRTGLAPASISGILDRLEERGLVTRSADPTDRRRTLVDVREEGIRGMYALFEGLMRRLGELHEQYSVEELALVARYLRKAAEIQREATTELSQDRSDPGGR